VVRPDRNARVPAAPSPPAHYLLATDSVHTTAAGCDYLLDAARFDPDDRVTVLTVADPAADILLVGPHGGSPGSGPELGGTAEAVVEGAGLPAVVLPPEALS
jgi:hypothetical protein